MKHTSFRSVLVILLFFIIQSASGQKSYDIEIILSGTEGSNPKINTQVYQGYRIIPLKKVSTNLVAEKIDLSAKYPIIEISYFSDKHAPALIRFFIRNEKCKLVIHYDRNADKINVDQISGVTSFDDGGYRQFRVFAKEELELIEDFERTYKHDFSGLDSSVLNKLDRYTDAVKDKAFQFVKKHPDLLYSTWLFIYELVGYPRYTTDEQLNLYAQSLKPRYKGSFEEKLILNELDKDRLSVNRNAPLTDKTFKDLHGSSYTISSFGKKLVLVNIWSTGCVPCVEEIPRLQELYARYKTSMEIISICTDSDEQNIRNFIKAKNIGWINVYDQPEISRAYGSDKGIPQVFLINEKGIILYSRSASADSSLDILEKTLAYYAEKE